MYNLSENINFDDVCWCGHHCNEHFKDENHEIRICGNVGCNCRGFMP